MKHVDKKVFVACGSIIFAGILGFAIYKIVKKVKEDKKYKKESDEINADLNKDVDVSLIDTSSMHPHTMVHMNVYDEENDIREKLLKNWNKPPIGKTFEDEMAENEHPLDDDENEENIDEDELKSLEENFEDETFYRENKNKKPEVIREESLGDLPGSFEVIDWILFTKDDVLTDEDEVVIEDYKRFIGDALDDSSFRDNDEEDIYILSYEFRCVYHITKYLLSYEEKVTHDKAYVDDLTRVYGYTGEDNEQGDD